MAGLGPQSNIHIQEKEFNIHYDLLLFKEALMAPIFKSPCYQFLFSYRTSIPVKKLYEKEKKEISTFGRVNNFS